MNIGIDIGGSHIGIGLVDNDKKIVSKKEYNWTKEEQKNMPQTIAKYTQSLVKELIDENKEEKIKKIGIGFPSGNIVNGIIYKYGVSIDFREILKEFNIPVYVKNDVKCSSLCEKNIGNLINYDNCVFITLGTGIGGAYFYKNELVKPNKRAGMEIGHMVIDNNGIECSCGRKGCFEKYASMKVFRGEIEKLFNIESINSYKMFEIIESKEKEQEVNEIINQYIYYLSLGLENIINILEPDAICIGGSFTYYQDIFLKKLREKISKDLSNRNIPDIITAKYENDAGIIGSSMLEENS